MTKKKKKQANTSARGYATTSIPSKNKETIKTEIESQDSSTISEPSSITTESIVSSKNNNVDTVEENINEEESYINSIIEKFHDLDLIKVDAYFIDSQDLVGLANVNEMQILSL